MSGLNAPLANALTKAAAKAGRPVLAVPAGPLGASRAQTLQPGSAVAVGYSNGDVRTSATGTVAYVDGDRVWIFGHELEGNGRRALLLQDAYVYKIINNPLQIGAIASTYKLAASATTSGRSPTTRSARSAGRLGALPPTVPIAGDRARTGRQDAHRRQHERRRRGRRRPAERRVVDVGVAPLAVTQARRAACSAAPARLTGEMCARITRRGDQKPLRFCNRYVSASGGQGEDGGSSNAVLSGAANDLGAALATIDAYTGKAPTRDRGQRAAKVHRGADQAFIRDITLPARVRPGQRVRVAGRAAARPRRQAHPHLHDHDPARRPLAAAARCASSARTPTQGADAFTTIILGDDEEENEGGDPGPATLDELAEQVRATQRYDGVRVRFGRVRGEAFRDDDFRISGQAETTVRVSGASRTFEAVDDARRRGAAPPRAGARRPGPPRRRRSDAAIISTSVSTGVASSLTPFA